MLQLHESIQDGTQYGLSFGQSSSVVLTYFLMDQGYKGLDVVHLKHHCSANWHDS